MQYYICLYCIGFSAHDFSCYSSSFKVGRKWKCAICREARQKDVRPKKNSWFWKCERWEKYALGKPQIYFLINFTEIFYLLFLYFCFCLFFGIKNMYSDTHSFFCPKVSWHCHQRGPSLAEHSLSILPLTLNLQFDSFGKSICVINWFGEVRNISQVIFWTFQRDTKEQKQKINDVKWWRCSHFSMIRDLLFQFKW